MSKVRKRAIWRGYLVFAKVTMYLTENRVWTRRVISWQTNLLCERVESIWLGTK
jgi:hypothetical protein